MKMKKPRIFTFETREDIRRKEVITIYSCRNESNKFARAALIAWKLTVNKAIVTTREAANTNI